MPLNISKDTWHWKRASLSAALQLRPVVTDGCLRIPYIKLVLEVMHPTLHSALLAIGLSRSPIFTRDAFGPVVSPMPDLGGCKKPCQKDIYCFCDGKMPSLEQPDIILKSTLLWGGDWTRWCPRSLLTEVSLGFCAWGNHRLTGHLRS